MKLPFLRTRLQPPPSPQTIAMAKHSKNNTASSIFSYAEHQKASAEYGTKRQRLGNESMRRFDACSLCLQTARDPVCCKDGHLFCKECAVNDLLSQKKDLKRQKEKAEQIRKEIEAEVERAKAAARERVLQDFERGQLGLASTSSSVPAVPSVESSSAGTKRPFSTAFEFSPSHVSDLVAQAEEAAARAIAKEQAEAAKGVLPDFWLPSLTPTFGGVAQRDVLAAGGKSGELKMGAMCRGGGDRHSFALKDLIPVKFTYHSEGKEGAAGSKDGKNPSEAVCPSCMKKLSNNVIMFLMKPCSHVVCRNCTETLVRPETTVSESSSNGKSSSKDEESEKKNREEAHVCVVCDARLKKKDIIELKREGTGFASGGLAETSRSGISFQG
ncbi:RING-type domain-containing protein [Mycena venus]|uniref:RING-type domain-containing protein n=1 Tax=Mycena venus TaxID=2733690 RepID=A0A8H7CAE4_9AGAR|nr:RING-type domain-containing protein [Mycena venus]